MRILSYSLALSLLIFLMILNTCGRNNPAGTPQQTPFRVAVTPEQASLSAVDQTVTLTASVYDQNGEVISGASVTWHSKDDAVANVNSDGLVRAVGYGATAVTATSGQVQGNVRVTVSNPARKALEALYAATNGENWKNSTNWLSDMPVSQWYGVSDGASQYVDRVSLRPETRASDLLLLDLSNNHLTGEIPSELGDLRSLVYLDLSGNLLTGRIPSELGRLSDLQLLDLSSNRLSGEIPSELGNLRSLRYLSLQYNADLSGPLPFSFSNLNALQNLSLLGTSVCAPTEALFQNWLQGIGNRSGVVNCGTQTSSDRDVLIALYNATGGPYWENRSNWLSNEPVGSWYGVSTNTAGRVYSLVLEDNNLNGSIPALLGNMVGLEMLDISDNGLSGNLPSSLGNLTNLITLDLGNNQLSGRIPIEVLSLPNLETLELSGNWFEGWPTGPTTPTVLTDREVLIALYNSTGGANWTNKTNWLSNQPLDRWYGVSTNAEGRVDSLFLDDNQLSGSIPPELGNLTGLESLWLGDSQLSGSIPLELGNLTSLQSLALVDNQLSGSIPPELGKLTSLKQMWLAGNQLSGSIPLELGKLTRLNWLHLYQNQLVGSIPRELGNLTSLEVLVLGDNQLSGSIPRDLGNLTNLTALHLGDNRLSGSIPRELGNLTELTELSLSTNQLSGSIPHELGQLTGLISLDLSRNQLTGEIPPELTRLTELIVMDLSQTQVCVPQTAEFQAWISGLITATGITYCEGTTPTVIAPADQVEFEALVLGQVLSSEVAYAVFLSEGRFVTNPFEDVSFPGRYSYTATGLDSGGVLTLTYDDGQQCTASLSFLRRTWGSSRVQCEGGGFEPVDYESQWQIDDAPDPDGFDIEVVWVGDEVQEPYRSAFDEAVARWERVIVSDIRSQFEPIGIVNGSPVTVGDYFKNYTGDEADRRIFGYVDDLRLYAHIGSIDGPGSTVASAAPISEIQFRGHGGQSLPSIGIARFDVDDMVHSTLAYFEDTVFHEIGHALGFGTLWVDQGLLQNPSLDESNMPIFPPPDTHFIGTEATLEFDNVGGQGYSGAKVPVQNEGGEGTRDSHWRKSVFGNEIMDPGSDPTTTTGHAPLSIITIASMDDLGYTVSYAEADEYTLPSPEEVLAARRASENWIPLNCFLSPPIPVRLIQDKVQVRPFFMR